MEYPFGHLLGRIYKVQMSSRNRGLEAIFHLNNRLIVLLNLKENFTLKKVSEYDQELPQSHTAYQPTARKGHIPLAVTRYQEDNY